MEPIQSDEWVEEQKYDAPALYYELLATREVVRSLLEQLAALSDQDFQS